MKKLGGGGGRKHLAPTAFDEEEENVTLHITDMSGDGQNSTSILGSSSPLTLRVPPPSFEQPPPPNTGPKSRPTSVQLRGDASPESGQKRRAIRKIRSNSMVQSDV